MNSFTISIFGNKIFLEILNELKLFSNFKIAYYEDFDLLIKNSTNENQLFVLFINESNKKLFDKDKILNHPSIYIAESSIKRNKYSSDLSEQLNQPFSIIEFEQKITTLIAKNEFKKNSLIYLNEYIIDKNGTIYTYDINTNTNYNSQAEKSSKIKGMKSIAKFLKEELLLLNNIRVVA